jgi:hypothetical protein
MEAHVSQIFNNGKLALDSVANNLQQESNTPAQLQAQFSHRIQGLPFLRSIAIVNPQGLVLASTNAADRGGKVDLQRLTTAPVQDERVVIGPWVSGRNLAQDARLAPVPAQLGFIPMVRLVQFSPTVSVLLVAQINPDALATYQQQLTDTTPPGTQVLLALDSGSLLAQVGNDSLPLGSQLHTHPLFQGTLQGHKGTYGPSRQCNHATWAPGTSPTACPW